MTLKDAIIREVENLPERRQADVLAFIRFIKIGLADPQTIEQRFADAISQARSIARDRDISEQDVDQETRAVRSAR